MKITWLSFLPCLIFVLFCFVFSGPSYETKQFLGASQTRNVHMFLGISHPRGSCHLISGAASKGSHDLCKDLAVTAVFISNEK